MFLSLQKFLLKTTYWYYTEDEKLLKITEISVSFTEDNNLARKCCWRTCRQCSFSFPCRPHIHFRFVELLGEKDFRLQSESISDIVSGISHESHMLFGDDHVFARKGFDDCFLHVGPEPIGCDLRKVPKKAIFFLWGSRRYCNRKEHSLQWIHLRVHVSEWVSEWVMCVCVCVCVCKSKS